MIQIAIDGPSASGKSTIAKICAKDLNITYLDTGAMYRGVTFQVLKENIALDDAETIKNLVENIEIKFKNNDSGLQDIYVNNQNVSKEIRSVKVTANVSKISAYDFVRQEMVNQQQAIAATQSVIMDGRDIGTVVLPQADLKIFLTASVEERAKRRFLENLEKGIGDQNLNEIVESIRKRDHYDSNREHSPLKKAEDAIEIDSSHLSIDQVVEKIKKLIKDKI